MIFGIKFKSEEICESEKRNDWNLADVPGYKLYEKVVFCLNSR